jgi:hypothetical protein
MKKLLRYFIGSAVDAPSAPPKPKAVPAHEIALKQVMARRRDEAAKGENAGETPSAVPKGPVLAKETAQKGEGRGKDGGGGSPPLLLGKPRRERRARHGLADIAVDGVGKVKRKKSRQPDEADAVVKSKRRKRGSRQR